MPLRNAHLLSCDDLIPTCAVEVRLQNETRLFMQNSHRMQRRMQAIRYERRFSLEALHFV